MYFSYLQVCSYMVVTCAHFTLWDHILPLCCALGAVLLHYRKNETQVFTLSCVSSKQNCQLDPDFVEYLPLGMKRGRMNTA